MRKAAAGFVYITLLIDWVGIGIVFPIIPRLLLQLGDVRQGYVGYYYGLLLSAYALAMFLFGPVVGALSDRVGRRPIILMTLVGAAISYSVFAVANSIWVLVGARALAGAFGANTSTAAAYIADVTAPHERAAAFGRMGAVIAVGTAAGPVLGGVAGTLDTRLPFWIAAGLALLNVLYGLLVLPESRVATGVRGISARLLVPLTSVVSMSSNTTVRKLLIWVALAQIAGTAVAAAWVVHVQSAFHWTPLYIGSALALWSTVAALVQWKLVATFARKFGFTRTVGLSSVFLIATFVIYASATTGGLFLLGILISAFGAIGPPTVQSWISMQVPMERQGELQGAFASLGSICSVIGPGLSAVISLMMTTNGLNHGSQATFEVSTLIIALGLCVLLWPSANRERLA